MRCAVTPHLGQTSPGRWVDTNSEMPGFGPDNHVYVHEASVREMARLLGFPSPEEHEELAKGVGVLNARIAELEAERDALKRQVDAVHVLKSAGFQAARKPGRPAKERTAA
jgi:hypothetical protein